MLDIIELLELHGGDLAHTQLFRPSFLYSSQLNWLFTDVVTTIRRLLLMDCFSTSLSKSNSANLQKTIKTAFVLTELLLLCVVHMVASCYLDHLKNFLIDWSNSDLIFTMLPPPQVIHFTTSMHGIFAEKTVYTTLE